MGTLEKVPDPELMDLLTYQVSVFEQAQGSDWKLEDAPTDFLELMASGVFGIRFTPERCRVHKKISQNRPMDQRAVIAWTKALHTPSSLWHTGWKTVTMADSHPKTEAPILLTTGEPGGIGPDLVISLCSTRPIPAMGGCRP
ncbi:MAG: hypothetical protein Ct9H300mP16_01200 [Pseudomonadota bacterium]|nr:MAG: hypothetical protein Ct9H300mP16_01200 [Pseudomonadota bacterium]